MPAPLLWIGAGLAAGALSKHTKQAHSASVERVKYYPGESDKSVVPVNGAIVCCDIYGAFEHTGIWVDGNIIELKGNGLIRAISPSRFLENRSGSKIYILCDEQNRPLVSSEATSRAVNKLFEYSNYHLIRNNCHRFSWYCISGENRPVNTFHDLNINLQRFFNCQLAWYQVL